MADDPKRDIMREEEELFPDEPTPPDFKQSDFHFLPDHLIGVPKRELALALDTVMTYLKVHSRLMDASRKKTPADVADLMMEPIAVDLMLRCLTYFIAAVPTEDRRHLRKLATHIFANEADTLPKEQDDLRDIL